jgi:hypothetical protein
MFSAKSNPDVGHLKAFAMSDGWFGLPDRRSRRTASCQSSGFWDS